MTSNIISRLKALLGFLKVDQANEKSVSTHSFASANYPEREPSARDYEIYYWCASPAPWY
ncbi:hypothetical protein HGP17_27365 [Rhizobium sp. P38BS-XIX]|uniref:hypothetical protein n=1 Tax=Rhizobium sp. P38BS-XIX TaxID=2726740 RepID=UPI0014575E35|nr:hypothetical protein [Rhizobium sp. P38BS-XIX]NLS00566.1 hypothetical protein [Rhizobium sp. P38BS-XIX]